ncbi:MAG: type II toxin-antitoxin system YafQ family toxin [Mucilaginibacter sp.]
MPPKSKLVLTKGFKKSYKKFIRNNQALKASISSALKKLEGDIFDPALKTHKLGGKLAVYLSCSCGYDCRIIFKIEEDLLNPGAVEIVLFNIGTHDDVY